jgi:hypothetical protein
MDQAIETLQFCSFFWLLLIFGILHVAGRIISSQRPEGDMYAARVAYGVFLAYAVLGLGHFGFADLSTVAAVLIRALLFAGIIFSATCCVMPPYLVLRDRHRVHQRRIEQLRADRERRKSQEERDRVQREAQRHDAQRRRVFEEADRKQRAEAEVRLRAEQQQRAQAKLRIAQACARCELLFSLYKADIQPRFTRKMLDDFMRKYMQEREGAGIVEKRADELCAIMERHREILKGKSQPMTIDQLATWFLDEKKRIEALAIDDELKDDHLAHLHIRYAELSQQILEKLNP